MNDETTFPRLIQTPRLELHAYSEVDAPAVLTLVDRNREQLKQNFAPIAKGVLQPVDADTFVRASADRWRCRKEFLFGIWCKMPKDLVGQIKAKNIVWEVPAAELSYFIDRSAQRQGFAAEAISAILRVAFEELQFRRICLRIVSPNNESLQLAEKLGFNYEGTHRKEFRCGFGELHDVRHYALTDEDYPRAVHPVISGVH